MSKVVAVHDPCPRPNAGPGQLSALNETERRRAVEAAKTTVDTAVRLGANAVPVEHLRQAVDFSLTL